MAKVAPVPKDREVPVCHEYRMSIERAGDAHFGVEKTAVSAGLS